MDCGYKIKLYICFQKGLRGKRRGAGLLHRRGWDALYKNYQPDSFHL